MMSKEENLLVTILFGCICLTYFSFKLVNVKESLSDASAKLKFNIILISVDSLRTDHLSCYGYERNTSPNICALAQEGVLFKNAYSQGTETIISLPSLISSKFPPSHGVYWFDCLLPANQLTFMEILEKKWLLNKNLYAT